MKLRCHRPTLLSAFQVVNGVVPTRTPREILRNVKLQITDGKATLTGTDQEVGIRYEIAGVESETQFGEVLLPTQRMISILREVQDDEVTISVTEKAILLKSGHSEFRLSSEDPAEFPAVAEFSDQKYHKVQASVLREMIRRTVFATDPESHRYALGGVLVELAGGKITMAATDSRRLSVVKAVCDAVGVDQIENKQPVIPSKALNLVERSLSSDEEEVLIAIHSNDVLIKCENSTIYSRLVEGRFPRYQDVIPPSSEHTIDLIVGPFYAAVRQSQIVTNEETRGVDFTFHDGLLTLTSRATDVGESKIELPVSYEGEELTITFEPKFLAEFLRVLEPETAIKLGLNDAESAAVFRTEDNYTYIVMPLSRD